MSDPTEPIRRRVAEEANVVIRELNERRAEVGFFEYVLDVSRKLEAAEGFARCGMLMALSRALNEAGRTMAAEANELLERECESARREASLS